MELLATLVGTPLQNLIQAGEVRLCGGVSIPRQIDDESYVEFKGLGFSLIVDESGTVTAVQFFAPNYQGYSGFSWDLPTGVSFSDTRELVQAKLGIPFLSGGGNRVPTLGVAPKWDKFTLEGYVVYARYGEGDRLVLLEVSG